MQARNGSLYPVPCSLHPVLPGCPIRAAVARMRVFGCPIRAGFARVGVFGCPIRAGFARVGVFGCPIRASAAPRGRAGGATQNSPAPRRWEPCPNRPSPGGTTPTGCPTSARRSQMWEASNPTPSTTAVPHPSRRCSAGRAGGARQNSPAPRRWEPCPNQPSPGGTTPTGCPTSARRSQMWEATNPTRFTTAVPHPSRFCSGGRAGDATQNSPAPRRWEPCPTSRVPERRRPPGAPHRRVARRCGRPQI
jgi:hypothetical protein